jgi:hypothetical protein
MKRPAKARHQCRRCPLRSLAGRCLNPALKSGRCGDWIWYVRGGKQCRRRYARPKDPRTLAQLLSRARLSTSSRRYSRMLTDEERAACMAAGAKLRSRPRLAQSGPLTGQQYWVRKDSAHANVNVKSSKSNTAPQPLQPQRVTRSTSGLHRSPSRGSPGSHRLGAVQARQGRGGRGPAERRSGRRLVTVSRFAQRPPLAPVRQRCGIARVSRRTRVRLAASGRLWFPKPPPDSPTLRGFRSRSASPREAGLQWHGDVRAGR